MLLAAIGDTVERAFTEFFAWLPNLVGALVVLIVGWFLAKLVGSLVGRALHRAGLDRSLGRMPGGRYVERATTSPSHLLGTVAFWAVLLGAVSLSVTVLGIDALEAFVASVYEYLPNVIAAVLIFLVAGAIAAGVATLAARTMGDTGLGKVVATGGPILVMTIATFMILDQLMIAENIVTITYAGLVLAISLGAALAFGLGGREVARDMLTGAYEKREDFKRDLDQGMTRAREEAERLRDEASPAPEDSATERLRSEPAPAGASAPPAPGSRRETPA